MTSGSEQDLDVALAAGVLATQHGVSIDTAVAMLRSSAQDLNITEWAMARRVVQALRERAGRNNAG